jgi:hypothetical protein
MEGSESISKGSGNLGRGRRAPRLSGYLVNQKIGKGEKPWKLKAFTIK